MDHCLLCVVLLMSVSFNGRDFEGIYILREGSPTPRPWTGTSPWPVRNQAAQQEVSGG